MGLIYHKNMKAIERIVKHYITSLIGLILISVSGWKILSQLDTIEWERLVIYATVGLVGLALFVSTDKWIKETAQKLTDKIVKK